MSENQDEKNQADSEGSDEFDFYFPFTKPLVLDLPSSEDRAIAAAWVQKLEAEPETEEDKVQRLNYLKLLLFVLQRGRLSGIFKKQPPSGPLEPFPVGFSILDMGNLMLDQDDSQGCGAGDARNVPYNTEISNDLREYVASQEVPNFGIQMYYAWSSDQPVHKWISFDEGKFPQFILDKIKILKDSKSDEKASLINGCLQKKKNCDMTLPDTKKKVKSPQEIEKSQGRSFHTYMGLVGQLGNFNDKCDDDPEKYHKQDPRKEKLQKKNNQRNCPGEGGEAEDMAPEEECDNFVSGLGGLNAQNRPCLCPYPLPQGYPEQQRKGGPQPLESQQPNRNRRYAPMSEAGNCPPQVSSPPRQENRMRELCPENDNPLMMPQRYNQSPSSRNASPNPPSIECPEDNSRGSPKQPSVCICPSPPCTCSCPRATSPRKPPSPVNRPTSSKGVRSPNPAMTVVKQNQAAIQNPNCAGRPPGQYLTSFKAPDPYYSRQMSPDATPVGGRSYGSSGSRPQQLDVVHCYDSRNPDPYLNEGTYSMPPSMGASPPYRVPEFNENVRRQLFTPIAQSTALDGHLMHGAQLSNDKFCSTINPQASPELESHYLCENTPPGMTGSPHDQNFTQFSDSDEAYQRVRTSTYIKALPEQMSLPSNAGGYPQGNNIFDPNCGSGRLQDMARVLKGMKQITEAHREKCGEAGARRMPPPDPCGNIQTRTQVKSQPAKVLFDGGAGQRNQGNVRAGANQFYSPQYLPNQQCDPQNVNYSYPGPLSNRAGLANQQQKQQQQQQPFPARQQMQPNANYYSNAPRNFNDPLCQEGNDGFNGSEKFGPRYGEPQTKRNMECLESDSSAPSSEVQWFNMSSPNTDPCGSTPSRNLQDNTMEAGPRTRMPQMAGSGSGYQQGQKASPQKDPCVGQRPGPGGSRSKRPDMQSPGSRGNSPERRPQNNMAQEMSNTHSTALFQSFPTSQQQNCSSRGNTAMQTTAGSSPTSMQWTSPKVVSSGPQTGFGNRDGRNLPAPQQRCIPSRGSPVPQTQRPRDPEWIPPNCLPADQEFSNMGNRYQGMGAAKFPSPQQRPNIDCGNPEPQQMDPGNGCEDLIDFTRTPPNPLNCGNAGQMNSANRYQDMANVNFPTQQPCPPNFENAGARQMSPRFQDFPDCSGKQKSPPVSPQMRPRNRGSANSTWASSPHHSSPCNSTPQKMSPGFQDMASARKGMSPRPGNFENASPRQMNQEQCPEAAYKNQMTEEDNCEVLKYGNELPDDDDDGTCDPECADDITMYADIQDCVPPNQMAEQEPEDCYDGFQDVNDNTGCSSQLASWADPEDPETPQDPWGFHFFYY